MSDGSATRMCVWFGVGVETKGQGGRVRRRVSMRLRFDQRQPTESRRKGRQCGKGYNQGGVRPFAFGETRVVMR